MTNDQHALPEATDAIAFVEYLRMFPPQVHEHAPTGVWAMAEDALAFLAANVTSGSVTVETGCGASTAVFAWRGATHTAMFLREAEGTAISDWLARAEIDAGGLELIVGSSTVSLPRLVESRRTPDADLLVVDGCHAFPFPMVDWYFGAKLVRRGGIVLVDDVQLPAPRQLADFLAADPRWTQLSRTSRWAAFRKDEDWSHDEEWTSQLFFRPSGQGWVELRMRISPLLDRGRSGLRRYNHGSRKRLRMFARSLATRFDA